MAENLQDLKKEVVKVEVPSLKEMSVERIFHLLNKVTESDEVLAHQHYEEALKVTIGWAPPRLQMHRRNKAKNEECWVVTVWSGGISENGNYVRNVCGWCKLDEYFKDNMMPRVLETTIKNRIQETAEGNDGL